VRTDAQKRLTLVACILGSTIVTVDGTVTNVALPAIENELGGGLAGQQWTANAYLLTLGSLLLIGGSLGDVFGERRVFSLGVLAFGITSIFCAIAPTIELLVVARATQGVAGAVLTPAALAVIVATFEAQERSRAIGTWLAWSGIGTVLGPLVGGQIVDSASWRYIFAINVPLVAITLVMIARFVPEGRAGDALHHVDVRGAVLCALGLAGPTFALIQQPLYGWGSPAVLIPLIGGILVFESRTAQPMLPLELFKRRNFAAGNIETLAMYGGLSLVIFFLILFLQQVAGYSALKAGLSTVPITVVMFFLSGRFGGLADRFGPRFFMGVGPLVASMGLALLLRLDENVDYVADLLPALVLFALGLAMTVAPLTSTVLADADERNAGVASGVNNAIARVSGLLAVAAIGAVVAGQFGTSLDDALAGRQLSPRGTELVEDAKRQPLAPVPLAGVAEEEAAAIDRAAVDASIDGFRVAMGLGATLVALGGILGLLGIRNPRRRVEAKGCAGGQFAAQPEDAARERQVPAPEPARA